MKALIFAAAIAVAFGAGSASAQNMVDNAAGATGDVFVATGRLAEAGGKLVIGTLALPFIVVGKAAEAIASGVDRSGEAVYEDANGPLVIGGDRWNDRDGRRDDGMVVVRDTRDRTWHADRNDW
ncbi:MAG: hypothetical protein JF571_00395 [Asticcacaulis sp.]|nr:hypothetical protein [Asticcacaulis sp.]